MRIEGFEDIQKLIFAVK